MTDNLLKTFYYHISLNKNYLHHYLTLAQIECLTPKQMVNDKLDVRPYDDIDLGHTLVQVMAYCQIRVMG